jgi:hypothetical protein
MQTLKAGEPTPRSGACQSGEVYGTHARSNAVTRIAPPADLWKGRLLCYNAHQQLSKR